MVTRCLLAVCVITFYTVISTQATTTTGIIRNKKDVCTLNCPDDAPCRFGAADFSGQVMELGETSHNGMHCDCPMGWTGIFCDKRFETCDNQAGHTCYHGGECIPGLEDQYGNEQLFCDCSEARSSDGTKYVGKYCETPFEKICNPGAPEDELVFCVNGGECNPDFPDTSSHPCNCDDGWTGFHCEFKHGSVPECTLGCQNGGVCLVGVTSPSEAEYMDHKWSLEEIEDHMRCACPPGVGGGLCESPSEQCGDSICLNGGKCVTTTQVSQTGQSFTQYHCDCTAAGDDQGNFFAGKYCEHAATSMCSESDWSLFCTQDGKCKTNPVEGCSCRAGTAGFKCEFILNNFQDEVQDDGGDEDEENVLVTRCGAGYCQNGGSCVIEEYVSDNSVEEMKEYCDCLSDSFNAVVFGGEYCQYRATTICGDENFCFHNANCNDDGTCKCASGWTGTNCQTETTADIGFDQSGEVCGDAVCFNGGVCAETEMIGPDGSLEVTLHCDCSSAFDDNYSYAGTNCQFPSTSLCTQPSPGDSLAEALYCVNLGTCMDDPQLGCKCPPGFYGFACEYESQEQDTDGDGIPDLEDDHDDDQGEWEACGGEGLVCHNGGRCQTTIMENDETGGTDTLYTCDCKTAYEGDTPFLGVSCEYPATEVCDPADDGEAPSLAIFCTNHGVCNDDSSKGCTCPDGFTGAACQFKSEVEDIIVVEPGENPIDYEECGDALICLNGGACTTTILADNEGEMTEIKHCDCSSAFDETEIFAGASCEHKATSLCASPSNGSVGNVHFCTNGGACPANNPMMPCKCGSAWQGFHCEYPVDADELPQFHDDIEDEDGGDDLECSLPCKNGGVCAEGAKDLGFLHDTISDVSHLNETFDKEYFAHCVCPEGFVGLTCQHKIQVCGDDEHVCLHGSTCVDLENGKHSCDCSQADETVGPNDSTVFAGDACQYTGTDVCTIGDDYPGKPLYFCVNGGTCSAQVTGDQPDPGCSCPDNYAGPHCEQRIRTSNSSSTASPDRVTLLISVIAIAATIAVFVVLGIRFFRGRSPMVVNEPPYKGSGTPFPRRRRRKAGFGGTNLSPPNRSSSDVGPQHVSSSDPVVAGFALPPEDEPDFVVGDGVMNNSVDDEPSYVDVGSSQNEHHQLDNVDFV